MKNYRSKWLLSYVLPVTLLAALTQCAVKPIKHFSTADLFRDRFYQNSVMCTDPCDSVFIPGTQVKALYLGFREQYVVNNNVIELSHIPARASVIQDVTTAIDSGNHAYHGKFIAPRDSEEIYILEIDKKDKCGNDDDNNLFLKGPGVYYVMISLKYSQFRKSMNDVVTYKVSGFGRAYIGRKQGVNDILFYAEPSLKLSKKSKDHPRYYYLAAKKRDRTMMLFEDYTPPRRSDSLSDRQYSRFAENWERKKSNPTEKIICESTGAMSFNYVVIGNSNQIGGNKYLDIAIDSVFDKQSFKFLPYDPVTMRPK